MQMLFVSTSASKDEQVPQCLAVPLLPQPMFRWKRTASLFVEFSNLSHDAALHPTACHLASDRRFLGVR